VLARLGLAGPASVSFHERCDVAALHEERHVASLGTNGVAARDGNRLHAEAVERFGRDAEQPELGLHPLGGLLGPGVAEDLREMCPLHKPPAPSTSCSFTTDRNSAK